MKAKIPLNNLAGSKTKLKSTLKSKPKTTTLTKTKTFVKSKTKPKILTKGKRMKKKVEQNLPVTEQLASVLDNLSFEEQSQVGESLVKTMVELNKIKKELRAEHIHKSIDQAMLEGKGKERDKVTCRKGCSHCCQQMVFITDDEADLLFPSLIKDQTTLPTQTLEYLKEQAKYDTTSIFDFWKLPKEKSACVFLKNNLCTVYSKRPSGCRTLQVTSKPDNCSKEKSLHTEILKKVNVDAEILAAAALGLPKTEYEPMPKLILKKYEEFIKEKEKLKQSEETISTAE